MKKVSTFNERVLKFILTVSLDGAQTVLVAREGNTYKIKTVNELFKITPRKAVVINEKTGKELEIKIKESELISNGLGYSVAYFDLFTGLLEKYKAYYDKKGDKILVTYLKSKESGAVIQAELDLATKDARIITANGERYYSLININTAKLKPRIDQLVMKYTELAGTT